MGVRPTLRIHGLKVLCLIILHLWHKNQAALGYSVERCRKKRHLDQHWAKGTQTRGSLEFFLLLVTFLSRTHTHAGWVVWTLLNWQKVLMWWLLAIDVSSLLSSKVNKVCNQFDQNKQVRRLHLAFKNVFFSDLLGCSHHLTLKEWMLCGFGMGFFVWLFAFFWQFSLQRIF